MATAKVNFVGESPDDRVWVRIQTPDRVWTFVHITYAEFCDMADQLKDLADSIRDGSACTAAFNYDFAKVDSQERKETL